jgi:hypothetical protein
MSTVDGIEPDQPSRPDRRWIAARWTSALALVALAAAIVVPGLLPRDTADPADGVVLPASIAVNAAFPSAVESSPVGSALLMFPSGDRDQDGLWHTFVMGVDGRTYRQLDSVEAFFSSPRLPLLAPDGSAVLLTDSDGRPPLYHLDLRTGATREIPIPDRTGVWALAWSPDLRTVALVVGVSRQSGGGELALLDVRTGSLLVRPDLGSDVVAAAWAPDSRELAVQAGRNLVVVDATGTLRRQIPVAENRGLKPRVAWSPDGRWLGTVEYTRPGLGSMYGSGLELVDATGGGRPAPPLPEPAAFVVGWLGPDRLLQLEFTRGYPYGAALAELSFATDGTVQRMAAFEEPHLCFLLAACTLDASLQVATNLLSWMEVRPADRADWGPVSRRWSIGGAVVLVWLAAVVYIRRGRTFGPPSAGRA